MIDKNELLRLKSKDINSCDTDRLTDISNRKNYADQRTVDKMNAFIRFAGNPYLFKVGETVVRVEYEGRQSFTDAFANLI